MYSGIRETSVKQYACVNGEYVEQNAAVIPIGDRGLRHGFGLFETLPVVNGTAFLLDEHVHRLIESARTMAIEDIPQTETLTQTARALIEKNEATTATLRIVLTAGADKGPNWILETEEARAYPEKSYAEGMQLTLSSIHRNPTSPLTGMKSLCYLENILARNEAQASGCDEALLLNTDQFIAEGSFTSIFFYQDGEILTPSLHAGILPGITRAEVIRLSHEADLRVREELFTLVDILDATEVFLTSSLLGIMPVYTLDGKGFGPVCPGPVTQQLTAAYQGRIRSVCG